MNSLTKKVVEELQSFIGETLQDFTGADIGEYVFALNKNVDRECQMTEVPFTENTSRWIIFDNKKHVYIDITVDEEGIITEIC